MTALSCCDRTGTQGVTIRSVVAKNPSRLRQMRPCSTPILPCNIQTTAFLSSCGDRTALFSKGSQAIKIQWALALAACGYHV